MTGLAARLQGRRLAAPSWVMPGTLRENCRFLSGRVDEAGLCFFEAKACLAYGPADLPPDLADLPLTYHVHLPLDLDWSTAGKAAAQALALMDKVEFLGAQRAVLHPPSGPESEALLRCFIDAWERAGREPGHILLENVPGCSLLELEGLVAEKSLQVCLDMGHVLQYNQERLLHSQVLMKRVSLFHANAPDRTGGSSRHLPLASLDSRGMDLGRRICGLLPEQAVIMPELFSWAHVEAAVPVLAHWLNIDAARTAENGPHR